MRESGKMCWAALRRIASRGMPKTTHRPPRLEEHVDARAVPRHRRTARYLDQVVRSGAEQQVVVARCDQGEPLGDAVAVAGLAHLDATDLIEAAREGG
jgi:hypothetical protein